MRHVVARSLRLEDHMNRAVVEGDPKALRPALAEYLESSGNVAGASLAFLGIMAGKVVCNDHPWDNVNGRVACLRLLLEAGANLDACRDDGWTPLHFAAERGHARLVAMLIRAGADVHQGNFEDATPLHSLCDAKFPSVESALLLIKHGAAVNARTMYFRLTPLDIAIGNNHCGRPRGRRLYSILLRAGAALPKETNAYIRKVIAAGGIERYEHSHLTTLIATFRPALRLPAQPARLVVQFAFHVGDY